MSFMSLSLPGDGMAPVSYMDNVTRLMPSLAAISSCEKPNFTLASLNVFAMSVSMADTIPPIVYGVKHLLHWVVSQFERKKYFLHIFLDALQHIAYFFLLKKKGGRSWLQW